MDITIPAQTIQVPDPFDPAPLKAEIMYRVRTFEPA